MSSDDLMLVLPGGGYEILAEHEAQPVARWLEDRGLAARVIRYPLKTRHPGPLRAVRDEIRRARAEGARRIAVIGFSAGGHAAGMAALSPLDRPDERVDAAVLCYPVTSMELETHAGSRSALLGSDSTEEQRRSTSLDRLVTPDAPPMFLWHTSDDNVVTAEHSLRLAGALSRNLVPHELHVFAHGRHGLGLADGSDGPSQWTDLCVDWLRRGGWLDR